MLLSWLKAHEATEAGSQLADAFAREQTRGALRDFIARATKELRVRKLSFYKRARFASAFKWRLLENGVAPETAHEVTQTILMQALMPPKDADQLPDIGETARHTRKQQAERLVQAEELLTRGDYAEAAALYRECVAEKPRDAGALNNFGVALSRLGHYEAAEQKFRTAIKRQPNHVEAHVNLGVTMLARGRFQDAENALRRALILKPTDLAARSNLGLTFVLTGHLDNARVEFEKVLQISPRHADTLYGMGMLARSEGRFEEAEEMLQRAIVANPRVSRAWAALAGVRKMTSADSLWLKRAEQAASDLQSPHDEAEIRYAIGKYFDDLGKHSQAFASYRHANELMKTIAPAYDHEADKRFVDNMVEVYSAENVQRAGAGGSDSDIPVLVVGMPRSGTSLVEQILASHPAVGGAGELPFWNDIVRKRNTQIRQGLLPPQIRQQIAEDYLRTLRQHCPGSRRIVDKTPLNGAYIGPIHSVFPRSRVIHVRRNALDTALSCYFQHFGVALNWSLDLSDIARFHAQHERVIAHWSAVLPPGTLLEVPYEELVAEPQKWIRRMLQFLQLDWDDRCLQFHRTQRAVMTSSCWQVRQPLYRASVERWRNYSKHLGPLRELESR